jgi:hypothetical protein
MTQERLSQRLILFYSGERSDDRGRTLTQIWEWDFEELECTHDYIQWLFPLPEQSAYNSNAPIVDDNVVRAFEHNSLLRQNLHRSLTVMLRFYGLQIQQTDRGTVVVTKSAAYPERQREWLCPFDHNYLRITRILKCLMVFGLEEEAQAMFECLSQIYRESSDLIGGETFQYWQNAVKS